MQMSQWDKMASIYSPENRPPNEPAAVHPGPANDRVAPNGEAPPVEPATSSSSKRLACNPCRERKVRCDRQQPQCSRCARVGNNCTYFSPAKPSLSKLELSKLLLTINNRLEHAEAKLALGSPPINPAQFSFPWPEVALVGAGHGQAPAVTASVPEACESTHVAQMALNSRVSQGVDEWSYRELMKLPETQFVGIYPATSLPTPSTDLSLAGSGTMNSGIDSIFEEFSNSSYSEEEGPATSKLPNLLLQKLHGVFFEVPHVAMSMVNRSRIHNELEHEPESIQVQALADAIGALGALSVPELSFAVQTCYDRARNLLDTCERQENGDILTSINPLQTCVLLCVYELGRPNFARAWMTLGRAIRLAKLMNLDKVEEHSTGTPSSSLLPAIRPAADVEERRRIFWLLYILDGFTAMRTNSVLSFDCHQQIAVPLPCRDELHDITEFPHMPTLQQVFELPGKADLSSFAGTVVVISLYRRCFLHIQSWVQNQAYSFWDNYYFTSKLLSHARSNTLASQLNLGVQNCSDPLNLVLQMNLAAVEINLHETAIAKVDKENLPASFSADAVISCKFAAKQISDTVRNIMEVTDVHVTFFQQMSPFLAWAMTKAIQTYLWMINHQRDDISSNIKSLQMLSSSMKLLILPEHIRPGLLEQVDAKISEVEGMRKRRYTQTPTPFGFQF